MLFITRGHFACACVHTVNDNSVGASNVVAGNRELAWSYSPFQSNFVGALNTLLSYKKCSPWQKIGRFLRGFSVVDFSTAGVLDFLKTLKRLNANNHCSFHCQSNAFPNSWFYLSRKKCIVAMFMPLWHFNRPYWRMCIQNAPLLLFIYLNFLLLLAFAFELMLEQRTVQPLSSL